MAISFRSYLAIEKKPSFKGIPLTDILVSLCLFIVCLLVGAVFLILGIFPVYWFAASFVVFFVSMTFLKRGRRNGHPSFFISYYSYFILQAKKITIQNAKLDFQRKI